MNKIPNALKFIKVVGQSCADDCSHWHELSGSNYPVAGGMVPCYERRCSGYYTYDAVWTGLF